MFKYKLVATDLDGTLLYHHDSVSFKNRGALLRLHNEGVDVAISTGRNLPIITHELLNIVGVNYIITSNGAAIYKNNPIELIYKSLIDYKILKEFTREVLPLCKTFQILYIDKMVTTNDANTLSFFESINNEQKRTGSTASQNFMDHILAVDDLVAYVQKSEIDATKMDIILKSDEDYTKFLKVMKKYSCLNATLCSTNYVEVTNTNISKGIALLTLGKMLHISPKEILAFGDSGNDLSMAEVGCDFVAMNNASDEVKQKAKFVTDDCDEDGFGNMIFRICEDNNHGSK